MIIINFGPRAYGHRIERVPDDFLPFFKVNEEGIRVMECNLVHIEEIHPYLRGRHLVYPVPQNLCAEFVDLDAASMCKGLKRPETDYCEYVLDLRIFLTKEKLHEILKHQYGESKIRDKKVEDCGITELLVAVNHKLKEEQTQSADG